MENAAKARCCKDLGSEGADLHGVGGWSKGAVPAGTSLMGDRLTVGPQTLTLVV